MKKYNKFLSLIILITGICPALKAQQKVQLRLGYSINQPMGSFKDVISKPSFRGFDGTVTYALSDQLAIGLGVGYNDFYEKNPRAVYQTSEGAISAVVTNSIQVIPVVAKANYSFLKEGVIKPYVAVGAGFNMVNYDQFLGEYGSSKVNIRPALTGDAGVNIPLGNTKRSGLNIGANFNYLPYNYNEIKNLNNWGIHAGVFFPLR
jgi:hypothetical protein